MTLKSKNSRFYELYGYTIAKEGITPIPAALFRYQRALGLSFQEVSFICHLLSYRWTSGNDPYPSIEKLSALTGISAKTLHSYKNSLVEKKKLKVHNRFDREGGQLSNGYDLTPLFEDIEKLIVKNVGCEKITYPPITSTSEGGITMGSHEVDSIQLDNVVVKQPTGKYKHISKQDNINHSQDDARGLQVLTKKFCGAEIPLEFFELTLQDYPKAKILEKLELLKNIKTKNIPGWLIAALRNDYKHHVGTKEASKRGQQDDYSVAPRAGAWIETKIDKNAKKEMIKKLYCN